MSDQLSDILLNHQPSANEISKRRLRIAGRVVKESAAIRNVDFDVINTRDLFELFSHYDELFFAGCLARYFENRTHALGFRLSKRMTSTGGMTTYHRSRLPNRHQRSVHPGSVGKRFEIAVSSTLLFNTTFVNKRVKVGGVLTCNRLDALQRIFEHELIHLVEMMVWDDSSCSKRRFKSIVARLFGHTESNHQLITPAESAVAEFGITTGDTVSFLHKGKKLIGVVNGIKRRATVLVRDDKRGQLFSDNSRYQRFYVSPERLTRLR